jgi:hypothetical protein
LYSNCSVLFLGGIEDSEPEGYFSYFLDYGDKIGGYSDE